MDIKKPDFSIIIPLFNGEKYIFKTILSCLNQTYKNIEVIIIDDCSKDNGVASVKNIIKENKMVKLYRNDYNKGVIKTVNLGIKLSVGKYVLVLGQDDMLSENHLEMMLKEFSNDTALVFCSSALIDSTDNIIQEALIKEKASISLFDLSTGNIINSCGLVMNRKLLEKVNYFTEREEFRNYAEWDMWIKLSSVGELIYTPNVISYYRRHESNMTNAFNEVETMNKLYPYFKHCRKLAYQLGSFTNKQKIEFWLLYFKYMAYHKLKTTIVYHKK